MIHLKQALSFQINELRARMEQLEQQQSGRWGPPPPRARGCRTEPMEVDSDAEVEVDAPEFWCAECKIPFSRTQKILKSTRRLTKLV